MTGGSEVFMYAVFHTGINSNRERIQYLYHFS